jgi:hypothetical protein
VNARTVILPLGLGTTTAVAAWIVLQTVVLAVVLGRAGRGAGVAPDAAARGYAVATGVAGAAALAAGAAVCARLLVARDVAARNARRVAHAQSTGLTAVALALGEVIGRPALAALTLLVAGSVVGALLGALAGSRPRATGRGQWS